MKKMEDNDFKLALDEAERIQKEIEDAGMSTPIVVNKYKKKLPMLSKLIVTESKRRLANGAGE